MHPGGADRGGPKAGSGRQQQYQKMVTTNDDIWIQIANNYSIFVIVPLTLVQLIVIVRYRQMYVTMNHVLDYVHIQRVLDQQLAQ